MNDDDEDDDVIKEHAGERHREKNEGQNYMSTIENESQAKKRERGKFWIGQCRV